MRGEPILYKLLQCIYYVNVSIIYLTVWIDGHLNSFRICLNYKDGFKAIHFHSCVLTSFSSQNAPHSLGLLGLCTFCSLLLVHSSPGLWPLTWLIPVQHPVLASRVPSSGKALWPPEPACAPGRSSQSLPWPSPSLPSHSYCPSALQIVHRMRPWRSVVTHHGPLGLAPGTNPCWVMDTTDCFSHVSIF